MRSNNFLSRTKTAFRFIFQKGHVRIMTCGNCGNINIAPVEKSATEIEIPKELTEIGVKQIWREVDACCECGASVIEEQYWVY